MIEEILKAIPVFLFSMLKFILGPTLGFAARLHFVTTVLVTIGGMMTTVTAFTYFGEWIRDVLLKRFKDDKRLAPKKMHNESTWKKYGLTGIAFLTPLFLTPLGGTLLAVSSGNSREKIILFMLISATAWSLIFTSIVYFIGREVLPKFIQ